MTTTVKGVIFPHGNVPHPDDDMVPAYKYVVAMVIITDAPLIRGLSNETVIMDSDTGNDLIEDIRLMRKGPAPFPLGDLSSALMTVADMHPDAIKP